MATSTHPIPLEVRDGNRTIRFNGYPLARVTSERNHAPRFVELQLFRITPSPPPPLYVFTRIGRSNVFHTADCDQATKNRLPYGHELPTNAHPINFHQLFPCPYCAPTALPPDFKFTLDSRDGTTVPTEPDDFLTTHRFEVPRHFAAVCPTPEDLLALLRAPSHTPHPSPAPHLSSPQRERYAPALPWLSQALLDEAILVDNPLQAYLDEDLT